MAVSLSNKCNIEGHFIVRHEETNLRCVYVIYDPIKQYFPWTINKANLLPLTRKKSQKSWLRKRSPFTVAMRLHNVELWQVIHYLINQQIKLKYAAALQPNY